jgi:hypothetical protein
VREAAVLAALFALLAAPLAGGASRDFDPTSAVQYYDLGNILSNSDTTYSIAAWIYAHSVTGAHVIASKRRDDAGTVGILFQLDTSGSDARFIVRDDANVQRTATASSAISTNVWHHVVGVRSGSSFDVYVDGTAGTGDSGALGTLTPDRAAIGALFNSSGSPASGFDGLIAYVAYFQRALTAEERDYLRVCMPEGVAPDDYWTLTEPGTTAFDIGNDKSGDGNAVDTTDWADGPPISGCG